jgi:hypothetical protein
MATHYRTFADGSIGVTYDTPEENPRFGEDGISIRLPAAINQQRIEWLLQCLHGDAARALPPGTTYDIRATVAESKDPGIAWYHVHAMKDWPVTGMVAYPGIRNPLGGYMQLGTFRTPDAR